MSERAKRFIEFMEDACGWECQDNIRTCEKCSESTFNRDYKYCPYCGSDLPDISDRYDSAIEQVEDGLQHALDE